MDARAVRVGIALCAALDPFANACPQSADAPTRDVHRIHVVRANDHTSVGGAEVFDLDLGDDSKKISLRFATAIHPEREIVPRAQRLVADGGGLVDVGPGRYHTLLARAPGWYQLLGFVDFERMRGDQVELVPDDPLKIELVDERGDPVAGAMVVLFQPMVCGVAERLNVDWRATSDRGGCVFFPHYMWWATDDLLGRGHQLALAIPVREPSRWSVATSEGVRKFEMPSLRWQLPALSKIRVEFVGADTLQTDRAISFELVGPMQSFGYPDGRASDHGAPVEVLTETGVPLRSRFHWREQDPERPRAPDLFAFGEAHPIEGGCALLRVPVAGDPIAVRVRPVRGDGSIEVGRFDVSFQWTDRQGFRLCISVDAVAADETGSLRFAWRRPRIDAADRPTKLRVALRKATTREDWETYEPDDLVSRNVDWPVGETLDVGSLVVPGEH